MAQIQMSEWQWPDEVRHLVCTPLSHAGLLVLRPAAARAAGRWWSCPASKPAPCSRRSKQHRITTTMLVPSMIYALLDHPDFADADLSEPARRSTTARRRCRRRGSRRRSASSGRSSSSSTDRPRAADGLRAPQGRARPDDLDRLAIVWRPVPWVRVGLLDDDGHEVPEGEPGELCVRGPLVMKGYWNKPEADGRGPRRRLAPHRRRRPRRRSRAFSRSSTARRT